MNEVPNNEQITDEPRFFQNSQLIIKPPNQLRVAPSPFSIALPQPLITKLAQIVFARFPSRNWIFWIFGASKLKIEMAALTNLERVLNRLRKIAEYLAHFIWRFEIELWDVAHPGLVLHHFASADAKHYVVRLVIAPAQKMHIVCSDQTDAQVSCNLWQCAVALALRLHSVVMQFDEKVFRPENVSIFCGALFCFFNVVSLNRAVNFGRETSAQPNQTRCPLCQQLFIDSWGVMKTVQMRCRYKLDEISIAGLVFGQ